MTYDQQFTLTTKKSLHIIFKRQRLLLLHHYQTVIFLATIFVLNEQFKKPESLTPAETYADQAQPWTA